MKGEKTKGVATDTAEQKSTEAGTATRKPVCLTEPKAGSEFRDSAPDAHSESHPWTSPAHA